MTMSTRQAAHRLRRSCLSVPGTQERFHASAERSAADQIMFDLEDSVAPAAKEAARSLVVDSLLKRDYGGRLRSVRINGCDTRWCHEDVIALLEGAGERLETLVVPKVEDSDHVHFVDTLLRQLEMRFGRGSRIGLELQIESARGMENVGAIAAASERTETLIFGPADFAASIRAPELTVGRINRDYPGDFWHFFLARICVAARARGLQPIDGPYAEIADLDGLRTSAARARMLGFDGKWALHPSQVTVINQAFAPTQEEFDRASAILEAYSRAADVERRGAVMFGEEMIDEASRKLAVSMVERGRALGMSARPWRPAPR
jgi:citrate lyase subunit beta / citryl-CoA lyase